jgi:hypothetical protein
LADVLERDERRLVLAIDNLDRVEAADALAIWSTLQTFLQRGGHKRPPWFARLWILVPFDREGILQLWQPPATELDTGSVRAANDRVSQSFLDKTFQVRFQVPPPVLTAWNSYLQQSLSEALPDHGRADFHGVYRAFSLRRGREHAAPTPRQLKLFVNDLGALHRQRRHEFPLEQLACYALVHRDGTKVGDLLRMSLADPDGHRDAAFAETIIGEPWKDVFAALYFNLSVPEARQVLLRPEIEAALNGGDAAALRSLATVEPSGFWPVFEDTLPAGASAWANISAPDLARAARACAALLKEERTHHEEAAEVARLIEERAHQIETWDPFNRQMAIDLVSLTEMCADQERFVDRLLELAPRSGLQETEVASDAAVGPVTWVRSAYSLVVGLLPLLERSPGKTIRVPLTPQQWIEVAPQLVGSRWNLRRRPFAYLELSDEAGTDLLLSASLGEATLPPTTIPAIEATLHTKSAGAIPQTIAAIAPFLGRASDITGVADLLRLLHFARTAAVIEDADYAGLAADGTLLRLLALANSGGDESARAACAFMYLQIVPAGEAPSDAAGEVADGHQELQVFLSDPNSHSEAQRLFLELVQANGGVGELARILASSPGYPLLNESFRSLVRSDAASRNPDFVHRYWRVALSAFADLDEGAEDAFDELVLNADPLDDLVAQVTSGSFRAEDARLSVVLLRAADNSDLVAWCTEGIRRITENAWVEELQRPSQLVSIVLELIDHTPRFLLPTSFCDALGELAKRTAEGSGLSLPLETWERILSALEQGQTELLIRRACEALEKSNGAVGQPFFARFGSLISDAGDVGKRGQFVDKVCEPILARGDLPAVSWLTDTIETDPAMVRSHADRAAVGNFVRRLAERLRDTAEDDADPVAELVRRLAQALNVEPAVSEEGEAGSEGGSGDAEDPSAPPTEAPVEEAPSD